MVLAEFKNDPVIKKAAAVLDALSLNKEGREIYEGQLKWLRDRGAAIEKARLKALEKYHEEVALRLVKKGTMSIEEIGDISGFSADSVHMLKGRIRV